MFVKLKITQHLMLISLVGILGSQIYIVLSVIYSNSYNDKIKQLIEEYIPTQSILVQNKNSLMRVESLFNDAILEEDEDILFESKLESDKIVEALDEIAQKSTYLSESIGTIKLEFSDYLKSANLTVRKIIRRQVDSELIEKLVLDKQNKLKRYELSTKQLLENTKTNLNSKLVSISDSTDFMIKIEVVLGFLLISITIYVVLKVNSIIIQRLIHIKKLASDIANGDWDAKNGAEKFNSNDELADVLDSIEEMKKQLKRNFSELEKSYATALVAVETKSNFLACMSHEIRTPLNGVLGMLGLVKNSELTDAQLHRLNIAQSSARSLLSLLNDILDFSKIEAGKLDLEIIDFNIREMLGEIAEAMALVAQDKGIEVILDLVNIKQSLVKGDPGRIRQIITNLVGNAIKFTDSGEIIIKVCLESKEDNLLMLSGEVIDSGIGIPQDKLEHLFDSFSQVDSSTTRKYGGTGLGLTICKELCELMNGDISVLSQVGKGSTFKYTLQLQSSKDSQIVMPQVDISKLDLLIVDDNEINREVLRSQLKQWGAKVTEVESGETALNVCEERIERNSLFDVALLDMQMPNMSGDTLGMKIRERPEMSSMSLVMMTSISHDKEPSYFADIGFDAFFHKPATTSDLLDVLNVVVDGGNALQHAKPLVTHEYLNTLIKPKITTHQNDSKKNTCWPNDCRILIVEDNRVNQEVIVGILEEFGLSSFIANDGVEAISILNNTPTCEKFNLVFMDLKMPNMGGIEATQNIRAGKAGNQNKNITIVAMTANAMSSDKRLCISSGMDAFLSKPVEPELIYDKLTKYLINTEIKVEHLAENKFFKSDKLLDVQETLITKDTDKKLLHWARDTLLKRIMGKEKLLIKLLESFAQNISEQIELLAEAIAHTNLQEVKSIAHNIKGASGNLSAERLSNYAYQLESAAKENKIIKVIDIHQSLIKEYYYLKEVFKSELLQLKQ